MVKPGTIKFLFLCSGIFLGAVWEMAQVHERIAHPVREH